MAMTLPPHLHSRLQRWADEKAPYDERANESGELLCEIHNAAAKAWHPATERAEVGRVVWVIECHPKMIYPQSYSIHAGTVEVAQGSDTWRVSQGDEAGCGWASWYPAIEGSTADEQFSAWAYVEDFTPARGILPDIED